MKLKVEQKQNDREWTFVMNEEEVGHLASWMVGAIAMENRVPPGIIMLALLHVEKIPDDFRKNCPVLAAICEERSRLGPVVADVV